MYNVSESYLAAMKERVRSDSVTGSITLSDGTVIGISDEVLVRGTLKLTRELCSGKYRIGSFDLACLRFSFFIDNALGLELAGATVSLSYGLRSSGSGGSGSESPESSESVPLGTFFIDPVQSSRRKNILSIVAYDAGVRFDREPSETLRAFTGTAPELIAAVCGECGVTTDVTSAGLAYLPNSDVTVSVKDRQIQSCRDIVMWCAALMCSYAVIGRDSALHIIPPKYDVESEGSSVIATDREIMQDERESIYVTDTRAYIKYLTAYVGSEVAGYTHEYISTDAQAAPAAYVLERNPLLAGSADEVYEAVNQAWLGYIHAFKQRGVQARIWGDPAIDVGDTVVFGGGDVDQRGGIIGVVTRLDWKYRGYTDIECLAAECVGVLDGSGSFAAAGSSAVRKQSDKRIDGLSAGGSGESAEVDYQFFSQTDEPEVGSSEYVAGQYWLKRESASPYTVQGLYKLSDDMRWETVEYADSGTSPGTPARTGSLYIINAPTPDGSECWVLQDNPDTMGWTALAASSASGYAKLYVSADDPPDVSGEEQEPKKIYLWAQRSGAYITALHSYEPAAGGWVNKGSIPQPAVQTQTEVWDYNIVSVGEPGTMWYPSGAGGSGFYILDVGIYWWNMNKNKYTADTVDPWIYRPIGSNTVKHWKGWTTVGAPTMTPCTADNFSEKLQIEIDRMSTTGNVPSSEIVCFYNMNEKQGAIIYISGSSNEQAAYTYMIANTANDITGGAYPRCHGVVLPMAGAPDTDAIVYPRPHWLRIADMTTKKAVARYEFIKRGEPVFTTDSSYNELINHWALVNSY